MTSVWKTNTKRAAAAATVWWLAMVFGLPLVLLIGLHVPGLLDHHRTGICPDAPLDIPAYPCTFREYLDGYVWGGWALAGQVILFLCWLPYAATMSLLYVFAMMWIRLTREDESPS